MRSRTVYHHGVKDHTEYVYIDINNSKDYFQILNWIDEHTEYRKLFPSRSGVRVYQGVELKAEDATALKLVFGII